MLPLGQERSEVKASGEDVRPVPSGILSERGNESRETRNPFYSAKRLDVGEFMRFLRFFLMFASYCLLVKKWRSMLKKS